jgi:hypothetical protein
VSSTPLRSGSRCHNEYSVLHRSGTKRFHHPVIGDVSFAYEVMELSADTGLTLTAYSPEAGSSSHDSVALLASWAATLDERPHDASSPHHRP